MNSVYVDFAEKGTSHVKLGFIVEDVPKIITNNLLTLKLTLYLRYASGDTVISSQLNYHLDTIKHDVNSIVQKIISSLNLDFNRELGTYIVQRYQDILCRMNLVLDNYNKLDAEHIEQGLIELSEYWEKSLREITAQNPNNESFRKYCKLAMLNYLNIDTVFDVGANIGQYAQRLFSMGYSGVIHSFEPQEKCVSFANRLKENFRINGLNHNWHIHQQALGDKDEVKTFHISEADVCSSFNPSFNTAVTSKNIATADLQITTLDNYIEKNKMGLGSAHLKVDAEGFDKEVLLGSKQTLQNVKSVEVESKFLPFSPDEWISSDLLSYLKDFQLYPVNITMDVIDLAMGSLIGGDWFFVKKNTIIELAHMYSFHDFSKRRIESCSSPGCGIECIV